MYPGKFKLVSASESGSFIPLDSLTASNIYVVGNDSNEVVFSVNVTKNETLTLAYVFMQSDALKPAILQPEPTSVAIDDVSGYKIAKDTIAITTDFPEGTKYVSDQYFVQKHNGPILNLVVPNDLGMQVLHTFRFLK